MLDDVLNNAPAFLLAAARCFALLMTLPLFSMRNVPSVARIALAAFMSYIVIPQVDYAAYSGYLTSATLFTTEFVLLLAGEALLGVATGFFVSIIFSVFSTAGQFFAFQMGFSASEVYDALSQVENPLMGQYFNMLALLFFVNTKWLGILFMDALTASFKAINAYSIVNDMASGGVLTSFMMRSLSRLFENAIIIALPIMGTLMLITIATGILSKAAPQMNLLSEGFPIMILTAFFIILVSFNFLKDAFGNLFEGEFRLLENLFLRLGGRQI